MVRGRNEQACVFDTNFIGADIVNNRPILKKCFEDIVASNYFFHVQPRYTLGGVLSSQ